MAYYQNPPGSYGQPPPQRQQYQAYNDYQQGWDDQQGYPGDDKRVTHGYGGFRQQNPYADEQDQPPLPPMPQTYANPGPSQQAYGQPPQASGGYGGDMYGGPASRQDDYAASYGASQDRYYGGQPPPRAPPQQNGRQQQQQQQQGGWDNPFPIFPSDQNGYQESNGMRPSMDAPRPQTSGRDRVSPVQQSAQPAYAPYKQPTSAPSFAVELPTPSNDYTANNTTQNGGFDFGQQNTEPNPYGNGPRFDLPVRPGTAPGDGVGHGRPQMADARYQEPPKSAGLPPSHDMADPVKTPPMDRGYWGDYEPGNIPPEATPKFAPPPPGYAHRPPPPTSHPGDEWYDDQQPSDNWNDVPDYGPRPPRGRGGFRPPARTRTEPPGWDGRGYEPRARGPPPRGRGGPSGYGPGPRGRGGPPPPRRADTYDNSYSDYDRPGYGRPPPPRSASSRDPRRERGPPPSSSRRPPPNGQGPPDGRRPDPRNGPPGDRPRGPPGAATSLSPPAMDGRPSTAMGSERSPQDRNGPQPASGQHQRSGSDSLPHHPTPQSQQPQRTGLQNDKPTPVRQYSPPKGDSTKPAKPSPVTQQELSRLREDAARNPSDLELQYTLAQKLSEAAYVLISTGDPKLGAKQKQDFNAEALKILKQTINKHHVEATFFLADSYGCGRLGLPSDPREAFALYQQAAKLGHPEAAYRTAVCCELGPEEGGGTRKDLQKAVQWYKHAATLGSVGAMFKLGMIQLKGLLGAEKDYRSAISWLQKASENATEEHPHACHELAMLYENPPSPALLQKNEEFAFSLYLKAAKLGYRAAQFKAAYCYEYGQMGCQIDARNSIIWYTKAAAQGEHHSELALSGWYLTGSQGILEQSDTEAYLWARKAANAQINDPALMGKATYAMGYFTEVGIGCPRSVEEAKKWYTKSASIGFPKARERLEEMKKQGERAPQRGRERLSRNNPKQHEQDCVVM